MILIKGKWEDQQNWLDKTSFIQKQTTVDTESYLHYLETIVFNSMTKLSEICMWKILEIEYLHGLPQAQLSNLWWKGQKIVEMSQIQSIFSSQKAFVLYSITWKNFLIKTWKPLAKRFPLKPIDGKRNFIIAKANSKKCIL